MIDGGTGRDLVTYRFASAGVNVYLGSSSAQPTNEGTDTLISIEDLWGSNHDDRLLGDDNGNWIVGLNGDDVIAGSGGLDILEGGLGNDVYCVGSPEEHAAAEITDIGGFDTVRFASGVAGTLVLFATDEGIERVEIAMGTSLDGVFARVDGTNIDARAVGNSLEIEGNEGTNTLWGTAFDDALSGRGCHSVEIDY